MWPLAGIKGVYDKNMCGGFGWTKRSGRDGGDCQPLAQGHFRFQNGGRRKALELAGHVTVLNIHEEINVCSNVANAAFLLVDLNLESRDGTGYEVEVTVLRS